MIVFGGNRVERYLDPAHIDLFAVDLDVLDRVLGGSRGGGRGSRLPKLFHGGESLIVERGTTTGRLANTSRRGVDLVECRDAGV